MSAAFYAQFVLNEGRPVAESIPATEHSVMTSWPTIDGKETLAVKHMIEKYGAGVFATVGDSYDWNKFLDEVVPECANLAKSKGGFWVVRPDSGEPVECVIDALHALEKAFGITYNNKGFKVINGAGVIQGDGIDINIIRDILRATILAGFSAENVAFGMGAGLLQKVNRDTMSFATKLCYTEYENGTRHDVWKHPKTDTEKFSLPGITQVNLVSDQDGHETPNVYPVPAMWEDRRIETDLLKTVYDSGPVDFEKPTFDQLRADITSYWNKMSSNGAALSKQMTDKIKTLQQKE